MDYARDLIWDLYEWSGGPLPPFLLEIIMKDGRKFYIHSIVRRDE